VITFITGYLNRRKLTESIIEAGKTTATILTLMVGAFIFMKFMTISRLTIFLPNYIQDLGLSSYATLFVIIVFYIFLGMFFDIIAGMVLTIPIIFPIVTHLGFDPIWFGVLLVVIMEMGLVTPPIGMNIFLLSTVTDVPIPTIFRGALPFVGAMALFIIILVVFPQLALYLPFNMMGS
jgi:TRAP-type C4-dicarboxylate transport system permease large subunit